jgi:heme-degrading monooxygenase HmoA
MLPITWGSKHRTNAEKESRMFTRVVHCTLKPEKRTEFNQVLHEKVLPEVKNQPGFVTLIGLTSDEKPDHAIAVTFWKSREDADRYYQRSAPMVDHLKSLLNSSEVEHFNVDGALFPFLGAGKAA